MKSVVVGVCAVVIHPEDSNKILAVIDKDMKPDLGKEKDSISIPMGHLEYGENPIEAVKRELFEETGLKGVSIDRIIGLYLIEGALGVVYLILPPSKPESINLVSSDADIMDVRWMDIEKFLNSNNLRPAVKEIVMDYLNGESYDPKLIKDMR